jgi:hypothetical protein
MPYESRRVQRSSFGPSVVQPVLDSPTPTPPAIRRPQKPALGALQSSTDQKAMSKMDQDWSY